MDLDHVAARRPADSVIVLTAKSKAASRGQQAAHLQRRVAVQRLRLPRRFRCPRKTAGGVHASSGSYGLFDHRDARRAAACTGTIAASGREIRVAARAAALRRAAPAPRPPARTRSAAARRAAATPSCLATPPYIAEARAARRRHVNDRRAVHDPRQRTRARTCPASARDGRRDCALRVCPRCMHVSSVPAGRTGRAFAQ